jgi:hypothetical protein
VYHGRTLREFKTYARSLERHFDKYLGWYITDERKITRALKHVAFNMQNEWKRQIRDMSSEQVTFGGLCTFLVHQLQIGVYPEVAKARYMDSYQRPFQSVTDFSNWIQQWESHFHKSLSERDRMRHLFEHLSNRVRDEADKITWTSLIIMISSSTCKGSRTLLVNVPNHYPRSPATPGSDLTPAAESTPST